MAIQEPKTVTITEEVEKEATVKAGTQMNVDFINRELQLTIEYGDLDENGDFVGLGKTEQYTIADEPEWVGECRESTTVDANLQITLDYDYDSNLEITKNGLTINGTVDTDKRTVSLGNVVKGDIVDVIYAGYTPPKSYFTDVTTSLCEVDSLAANVQSIVWNKLQELGKVSGNIVSSGAVL